MGFSSCIEVSHLLGDAMKRIFISDGDRRHVNDLEAPGALMVMLTTNPVLTRGLTREYVAVEDLQPLVNAVTKCAQYMIGRGMRESALTLFQLAQNFEARK
jgi:hypothetical protein